jgi:CHAD domain-containing protein
VSTLAEHVRALIDRRAERLLACREVERTEDPARAVHDLRVAARRLRCYLDSLEPWVGKRRARRLERRLRRVSRCAARLREWDVHAARVASWLGATDAESDRLALEHLAEWIDRHRRRERRRALGRRDRIDFDTLGRRLARVARRARKRLDGEPAPRLARAILEPRIEALFAALPARGGPMDPERMHEARLRTKELRYALECVEPALGDTHAPIRDLVVGLQELLGEHHDRELLEQLVREHSDVLARHGRATLAHRLAALLEPLGAEQRALYARFTRLLEETDRGALVQQVRSALRGAAAASTAVH